VRIFCASRAALRLHKKPSQKLRNDRVLNVVRLGQRTHCGFQNTRKMNAPAPSDMSRNSQVDTKRDRNFFKSMARTIKEKRATCPHDPAWPAARQMQVQQRTHEQPGWHLIEDDRACTHVGSRREKLTKLCSDMVQSRCGHFGSKEDVLTLFMIADKARARENIYDVRNFVHRP
jgi:hypothetical protein